jgi:PKD repeat protein
VGPHHAARTRPPRRFFARPTVELLEDRTLLTGGLAQATADVNFRMGRMVADPVRDLVYVGDMTHGRILAVDTDLGQTVTKRVLAAIPGALAASPGGDRLYVAEPDARQIQVLKLPDLTPLTTLPVAFPIGNLAAAANGLLVVSTPGGPTWNHVDVLDAGTGSLVTALSSTLYYDPLFRTNAAGTKVYVRETRLSGAGRTIDEYDLSGSAPFPLTNSYPQPLENSLDFLVDDSAGRIYTADGGVYGVGVTDMATKAQAVWSFGGAPYGTAVAALPAGPVYGASGEGIFQFDSGGTVEAQYPTPFFGVMGESLKITPNGHLLYCNVTGDNASELGILGASHLAIDDTPFASFTFTLANGGQASFDARASLPGQPGETLTSYAWDFGDAATAEGTTVTHTFAGPGPYAVRLTVTSSTGQTDTRSVAVTPMSAVPLPTATADVNFRMGRMVADPVRDVVYVGDETDARVLAVDTDLGRTVAGQALTSVPGALAVSVGGDRLFVAEPRAFQIQVLSLPGLVPVGILPVGFEVDNLVATANGHLFVTTPASFGASVIEELDAQTGAVLGSLPTQYLSPLLRTDPSGTRLYIREDDSGSGADGGIDAYDVGGAGPPAKTNTYPAQGQSNSQDFLVDEAAGRVFTIDGGVYGVGVTDTATGTQTVWSFGGAPYGIAVAALPGGPVYGASGDGIFQFDAGGVVRAQYATPAGVLGESLKVTPNGHLLYGNVTGDNASELGILGVPSLVIDALPVARFTYAAGPAGQVRFDASDSTAGSSGQTLTGYAWDFGDGATGAGARVTHAFPGPGPYTVRLTVTNSGRQSDELSLSVRPASALPQPQATADVNFRMGRMVADPIRDWVYVADLTNARILTVDTDRGRTVDQAALASAPGALAVSPRGDRMFVAEPDALQIQVLSLPGFNLVATLRVGIEVDNLVAAANDHLFVSTPASDGGSLVDEVSARTGKVLGSLATEYLSPLLRTNPAGTRLYIRENAGGSGADGGVDEYDVARAGPPSRINTYPAQGQQNSQDFLVDPAAGHVYTMDGGVYGVGVTDLATGAQTVWSFGGAPYGVAVAALPGGPVYGASGQGIFQFDAGGIVRAQYSTPFEAVMAESLKITPNGHLLYGTVTGDNTSTLGILGASSLVVDDVPLAHFIFTPGLDGRVSFSAASSSPGQPGEMLTSYIWDFGDGTAGRGASVTHTFAGPGPYTVKLTVTNSSGQSDEFILAVPCRQVTGNGQPKNTRSRDTGLLAVAILLTRKSHNFIAIGGREA